MSRAELKRAAKQQLGNGLFANNWLMAVITVFLGAAILGALSFTAVGTFILYGVITFGIAYCFLKQARDNAAMNLGDLFRGFSDDFVQLFLLGLMETIFIFLWTLLFIIPGIIKSCAYSQAYFIKADHPEYNWKQCLQESSRMMQGHKWEYFVLQLSFIGWAIVGALCFGIGTLWVEAYMRATYAQYYLALNAAQN